MSKTYRHQFDHQEKAKEYDQVQYDPVSYSSILWEVEKNQLAEIIEQVRETKKHIDYLDFASGTGRIISFIEDKVDHAVGIEISESMAVLARQKLKNSEIICTDITTTGAFPNGQYDFITTFRFVLNAEPTLRVKALAALTARLKDQNSLLVFNNHGNLLSHKLLFWPIHTVKSLGESNQTEGNYMTDRQVRLLADQAGLTIVRVLGCGLLSAKITRFMSRETAVRWEGRLARCRLLRPFCVNQMYVARRKLPA